MTVQKRVRTTLITLDGILADFNQSYIEASDLQTKDMFQTLIMQTEDILSKFRDRVEYIEKEEK